MSKVDFLGKGWKYPVSVEDAKMALSDDEELISQSIMIILGTAKGERVMRPDFGCGINEMVFAINDTSTATMLTYHVKEALRKFEPRIEVEEVQVEPDTGEGNRLNILIEYKILSKNTRRNLVYPFYLQKAG